MPSESSFRCYWWDTGLEVAGLCDARSHVGTYGRYEFKRLPPLPFQMGGDFAWLASAPVHGQSIWEEKADENAEAIC